MALSISSDLLCQGKNKARESLGDISVPSAFSHGFESSRRLTRRKLSGGSRIQEISGRSNISVNVKLFRNSGRIKVAFCRSRRQLIRIRREGAACTPRVADVIVILTA